MLVRPQLDTTFWPLVTVELPALVDDIDVEALAREQEAIFARGARYVSLLDATLVSSIPSARTRTALGEWAKRTEARLVGVQAANALVIPQGLARGAITAIHWIAPPKVPTMVCATVEEGLRFLEPHALAAGLRTDMLARYLAARKSPASRAR
ncbi:MAG: hypothetical protein MUF64_17115 [Polyangiaceae bacterium]|jgi:hypothetical protein|nr:hypothetical protein [Polyangiaceae bacterium]